MAGRGVGRTRVRAELIDVVRAADAGRTAARAGRRVQPGRLRRRIRRHRRPARTGAGFAPTMWRRVRARSSRWRRASPGTTSSPPRSDCSTSVWRPCRASPAWWAPHRSERRRLRPGGRCVDRPRPGVRPRRAGGGHARRRGMPLRLSKLAVQSSPRPLRGAERQLPVPPRRPVSPSGMPNWHACWKSRRGAGTLAAVREGSWNSGAPRAWCSTPPTTTPGRRQLLRNPVVDGAAADALPDRAPHCPQPDGRVKTSAAWLIEHAGFSRGYGSGLARLSGKHTLAITNRGGASAAGRAGSGQGGARRGGCRLGCGWCRADPDRDGARPLD